MVECEGYRAIAQFLAKEPGIVILNRFPTLNIQNLLYMQAELCHLEDDLQEIAKEDAASDCPNKQDYRYSFVELKDSSDNEDCYQWRKILEIRDKLEKYNDAILRYNNISALPRPPKLELSNLNQVLDRDRITKFCLKDISRDAWRPETDEDLLAVSNLNLDLDPFASWARSWFLTKLHRFVGFRRVEMDPETGLAFYRERKLGIITDIFRSLLITAVPAVSMAVLFLVKSMVLKLVFIVVFAGLFTLSVAIFCRAKTVDLFMLTAAFAAVQVVFLGTTN